MKKIFAIWVIIFLLMPVFVLAQDDQNQCVQCPEPGGFVPCGRKCDDPTTLKDECLPCTFCDFFIMIDRVIDSALWISIYVIVILIIAVTIITAYARKRAAPEIINKAKRALVGVVVGLIITYSAWAIVGTVLMALGFVSFNVNDLWVVNCSEPEVNQLELVKTYCGDQTIQRPNNYNKVEVCDGSDLGGQTCQTRGFESGNLVCKDDCSGFNESGCVAYKKPSSPSLPALAIMNPNPMEESVPIGYYCPKEAVGTWCGLKKSAYDTVTFRCDGHDPEVSCPPGYERQKVIDFGFLGYGTLWTCIKNL
jgi:hypothetical protein